MLIGPRVDTTPEFSFVLPTPMTASVKGEDGPTDEGADAPDANPSKRAAEDDAGADDAGAIAKSPKLEPAP